VRLLLLLLCFSFFAFFTLAERAFPGKRCPCPCFFWGHPVEAPLCPRQADTVKAFSRITSRQPSPAPTSLLPLPAGAFLFSSLILPTCQNISSWNLLRGFFLSLVNPSHGFSKGRSFEAIAAHIPSEVYVLLPPYFEGTFPSSRDPPLRSFLDVGGPPRILPNSFGLDLTDRFPWQLFPEYQPSRARFSTLKIFAFCSVQAAAKAPSLVVFLWETGCPPIDGRDSFSCIFLPTCQRTVSFRTGGHPLPDR